MENIPVRAVKLRLRAGTVGFETESNIEDAGTLYIPVDMVRTQKLDAARLLAIQIRDSGMEPMFFEDDWVVIDTSDTMRRSREVYAVNWNGEACVQQLVERGGQWYLNYLNSLFHPLNARSGQLSIVGRVVYQFGRAVIGRL